jgi:hypothetical protein
MSEAKRRSPADAQAFMRKKWDAHHANWLITPEADQTWPLRLVLHDLTERDVSKSLAETRQWAQQWQAWTVPGCKVEWEGRRWASGDQELPTRLLVPSADAAAELLGHGAAWSRAKQRYVLWCERFPKLRGAPAVARHCDEVLVSYSDNEFERFTALLQWFMENPSSGLYLRQLPVPGIHTKWVESRRGVVADLVRSILQVPEAATLYAACGLRIEPSRLRIRVLCPLLRTQVGGLCDIEAPASEIAELPIRPATCLIVENRETGVALPPVPNTVAFMRLGLAVEQLDPVPWIAKAQRHLYWGDLDTHGFVALARFRRRFPATRSFLMDEETLLANRALWGREDKPSRVESLEALVPSEHAVYVGLRTGRWGDQVRLEQERIPWPVALRALEREFQ